MAEEHEQLLLTEQTVTEAVSNMAEDSESVPLTYYQILVGDNLQVSFDNNAENNYWSFHDGSSLPNVSELFHMEDVGNNKVKILGYPPPPTRTGQVRWYLIITENGSGVPDKYPIFSPEIGPQGLGFTLHTEFTRHDNRQADTNTFGLSFRNKFNETYYLVPKYSRKRIGWSKTLQYPFLMITPAERELVDLNRAVKKCC